VAALVRNAVIDMDSLSSNQRPEGLSDRQYAIYRQLAFHTDIPDWPQPLLNSFGTETQTIGTARGYVAKWITDNPLEFVEGQI
jgi:hypothetical protein